MPRYRRAPLTLPEIWTDGPAVRIRDLVSATGFHPDTIYQDIAAGALKAKKHSDKPSSPFMVTREDARSYLSSLGSQPVSIGVLARIQPNLQPTHLQEQTRLLQTVFDLMGLGAIVRKAVAIADKQTGGTDGLQCSVTHEAWTGLNAYAKPTYASGVTRSAIVEWTGASGRPMLVRSTTGQDVVVRARVTFLRPIKANGSDNRVEPIDPRDRLTLPDGSIGPILSIGSPLDPSTDAPFFLEVLVG